MNEYEYDTMRASVVCLFCFIKGQKCQLEKINFLGKVPLQSPKQIPDESE